MRFYTPTSLSPGQLQSVLLSWTGSCDEDVCTRMPTSLSMGRKPGWKLTRKRTSQDESATQDAGSMQIETIFYDWPLITFLSVLVKEYWFENMQFMTPRRLCAILNKVIYLFPSLKNRFNLLTYDNYLFSQSETFYSKIGCVVLCSVFFGRQDQSAN